MFVAHRVNAGHQAGGVSLFGQIQQVHAVLNFLGSLTARLIRLIAIVEDIVTGLGVVGDIHITAEDLEHHFTEDIPCTAVVLAHAVLICISKVDAQISQCSGDGAQLEAFERISHHAVVCIQQVPQKLFQGALKVKRGQTAIIEESQSTLAVHHAAVVPVRFVV